MHLIVGRRWKREDPTQLNRKGKLTISQTYVRKGEEHNEQEV
jgi:hypothetical protein